MGDRGKYEPEPSVARVLLVPHTLYRPWTIQADAPDTKVFYYPVADENMAEQVDPYQPPHLLVQACKALGDEHRLRIVKHLAERAHSLQGWRYGWTWRSRRSTTISPCSARPA